MNDTIEAKSSGEARPKAKLRIISKTLTRECATEETSEWPVVTLQVRTAMPEEIAEYRERVLGKAGKEKVQLTAAFLAEHIKGWDVVDAAEQPVEPNKTTIAALPEAVFDQLPNIVSGYAGSVILGKFDSSSGS
jgi:predicted GNAT superfamily acetyltransferase